MNSPEPRRSMKKKADLKVVIIGDAAIGKTCLVHRYLHNEFTEESPNTIGAAFFLKQWGSHNIAIWDTAGEEKFSGLSGFYCRGANAAIVAYDIRDHRTFDSIEERYTSLLQTAAVNCSIVLAGTKNDLVTNENRQVTEDEGILKAKELCERWNSNSHPSGKMPYFETSARTGKNVKKLFEYIFETLTLSVDIQEKPTDAVDLGATEGHAKKCTC